MIATVVLWSTHHFEREIAQGMTPAIRSVTAFFGHDFTFLEVQVKNDGKRDTLRVRANLSHPLEVGGHLIYPLGWSSQPDGWWRIDLTLGGLFQYTSMLLIVAFAWPAANASELLRRTIVAVPLTALLLLVQIPPTILAELWYPLHTDFDSSSFWPLLAWSRFLMGGGGLAIALLLATICIAVTSERTRTAAPFRSRS